jgi:hypothetical protein
LPKPSPCNWTSVERYGNFFLLKCVKIWNKILYSNGFWIYPEILKNTFVFEKKGILVSTFFLVGSVGANKQLINLIQNIKFSYVTV